MAIKLQLAGTVGLARDQASLRHLSSYQAQVVLVRLTLERDTGTTRDLLADTLWPAGLPNTWASALRGVVSRVRAFLAVDMAPTTDPLVAFGGRYVLRLPDDTIVDLEEAEKAVVADRARALAAGDAAVARTLAATATTCLQRPLLPDHEGDWLAGLRDRYGELLGAGLETACVAATALADHGAAVGYADEAIRRAPLRESGYRSRMAALAAAGNRAEALRTYYSLRRHLAEELGVEPAPETESAYLDLLSGSGPARRVAPDRALLSAPAESASEGPARLVAAAQADGGGGSAGGDGRPDSAPGAAVPFVGRVRELGTLAAAWARAARHASHLVLVTGEAGVGKTRLAVESARTAAAQDGALVLFGRCDPGATAPYGPFTEALGGYLASTPPDSVPRLSPVSRARLAGLTQALPEPAAAGGIPLLVALTELIVGIARTRPVFFVIDDLHHADGDTLLLLRRLFGQCGRGSLLIVATARHEVDRPGPFAEVVHDLQREGWLDQMPLGGLADTDVRALVRHVRPGVQRQGPPAHRLIAQTGGNPFLVLELVRAAYRPEAAGAGGAGVPIGVRRHVGALLAALDPQARTLVMAAALTGGPFELEIVARAADLSEAAALEVIEGLMADGLVGEVPAPSPTGRGYVRHRYEFTKDVVRRTICDLLSDVRRRRLHGSLADAVEQMRQAELGPYTAMLADHRSLAAPPHGDARAVRWCWLAAARAREGCDAAEAVRLHRQALAHVPPDDDALRAEALTNLGLAHVDAGDALAGQVLVDAAIRARSCDRLDVGGRAALGLARLAVSDPRLRSVATTLVDEIVARGASEPAARRSTRGTIDELTLARLLAHHARLGGRMATVPAALVERAVRTLSRYLRLLEGPGQADRRLRAADELAALAIHADDPDHRVTAAHHRAMATELLGDLPGRDRALAALAAESGTWGDALLADRAAAVATMQGGFDVAATAARHPIVVSATGRDASGLGPTPGAVAPRHALVAAWLTGGCSPERAAATVATDRADPADRALRALLDGDLGRAHLAARALATGIEAMPGGDQWLHAAGVVALVAVDLREPSIAEAVREQLVPYADVPCGVGYRSFVGPASFHLGRLAAVTGDWADAERHLTTALRSLAEQGARPWMAIAQRSLAQALEARGKSGDRRWARALWLEADAVATDLGVRTDRPDPVPAL